MSATAAPRVRRAVSPERAMTTPSTIAAAAHGRRCRTCEIGSVASRFANIAVPTSSALRLTSTIARSARTSPAASGASGLDRSLCATVPTRATKAQARSTISGTSELIEAIVPVDRPIRITAGSRFRSPPAR
jgi:hypothetical protein